MVRITWIYLYKNVQSEDYVADVQIPSQLDLLKKIVFY